MSNVRFSVYGPDGMIRRSLDVPMRDANLNLAEDERMIEGLHDPDTTVVIDGVASRVPTQPAPWMTWLPSLSAWVDLRTTDQRMADLATRRTATVIAKGALLLEAMARGLLTPDEVDALSAGQMPMRLDAALTRLAPDLRSTILTRWRLEASFGRTHPVILVAAAALGVDDATLDDLFGVPQ
ncbi:hypothetical protein [Paracoccus lutimaris]|uniref:Uncharacterized protein n=1 Tax=Paracoccus lutimaris TaxID=1490030 RepID=A0A368YCU9_9RHOB|nr:hypothetical protein [Paracoccus lutimaris]RCW78071.1 hypothetical protein DFP89_1472 [Paracoccus lutimaris]